MPQKVLQRTYSTRFNDFALEFYSFVADNYAPFYSRPIECTDRDAPFVLDGVLYHESDLDLEEHYTDTHGYTEINFAAFGMVGRPGCSRRSRRRRRTLVPRGYGPRRSRLRRRRYGSNGATRTPGPGSGRPAPASKRRIDQSPRATSCQPLQVEVGHLTQPGEVDFGVYRSRGGAAVPEAVADLLHGEALLQQPLGEGVP